MTAMTAIQLLEQLGSSAALQRQGCAHADAIRAQAMQYIDTIDTPIKQWCILFPAEDEQANDNQEDNSQNDKEKESVKLN